jgi:hypothetical protein
MRYYARRKMRAVDLLHPALSLNQPELGDSSVKVLFLAPGFFSGRVVDCGVTDRM